MACSVLHNICQEFKEPAEEVIDPYMEAGNQVPFRNVCGYGDRIRDLLLTYINNQQDINSPDS